MQILQICLFPVATIFFDSVLLHQWKELTVRWSKKFAARATIPQLPIVRLQERAVEEMRNYALTYGAAVRQRINRYGTIRGIIYQRQLQISANRINLSSAESSELKQLEKEREVEIRESDAENDDEDLEYDSSKEEDEKLVGVDSSISELDRRSTFLVGAKTRFGWQVRVNHRYLV